MPDITSKLCVIRKHFALIKNNIEPFYKILSKVKSDLQEFFQFFPNYNGYLQNNSKTNLK
ncbi:hypothetical protein BH11BAC3_BH11BAC3_07920 [soil metagenome]